MTTAPESKPPRPQAFPPQGPRVRTHRHLSLVDWEGVALPSPAPRASAQAARPPDPARRSRIDRLYDRSVVALLVLTALAAAASLARF